MANQLVSQIGNPFTKSGSEKLNDVLNRPEWVQAYVKAQFILKQVCKMIAW